MVISKLQFITDNSEKYSHSEMAELACKGGLDWVQFRMKDVSEDVFMREALKVKAVCEKYSATFIINDRVEIAKEIDADGVHIGKNDIAPAEARRTLGNSKIIGGTANTFVDIKERYVGIVDYVGVGPFRFTTTKKNLSPVLGLDGYKEIFNSCKENNINLPIIAIGGLTESDFQPIMNSGVYGLAISSLITKSDDIAEKSKELIRII